MTIKLSSMDIVKVFLRKVLMVARNTRNFVKRNTILGKNVSVHGSVSISWSVSIDPARGEISIGKNSSLDEGVILRAYGGHIHIGEDSTINPYCLLSGGGGVDIGSGVRIASHTVIISSNHIFDDPSRYIFTQGETREGVVIEDDVWIGAGARILDGVTIGKGTVVGAGSVVTRSTEPYSVVVGVPARKVSSRLN